MNNDTEATLTKIETAFNYALWQHEGGGTLEQEHYWYGKIREALALIPTLRSQLRAREESSLKPEGQRTKADEWQACYEMLFAQLNPVMEENERLKNELRAREEWQDISTPPINPGGYLCWENGELKVGKYQRGTVGVQVNEFFWHEVTTGYRIFPTKWQSFPKPPADAPSIANTKPGTLPIDIDATLAALGTQYQFRSDAIVPRASEDAPTLEQVGMIRAAHLNIAQILRAYKALAEDATEREEPLIPELATICKCCCKKYNVHSRHTCPPEREGV